MEKEVIIKLSKIKTFFILCISLFFSYTGYHMIFDISIFIKIIGFFTISFFGYGVITIGKMLFDFSPGLIINSKGIFDNSSGIKAGMILWNEITDVTFNSVRSVKYITIHVADPDKYLKNGNVIKNFITKANNLMYDSPIHISSLSLSIDFDELHKTIEDKFKLYKENKVI